MPDNNEIIESACEKNRIAYTTRQKALYDYNEQMSENYDRGHADGFTKGKAEMLTVAQQAAKDINLTEEQIQELIRRMSGGNNHN